MIWSERSLVIVSEAQDIAFSVVIPSRGRSRRLARALESVSSQTYPALETIVVTDDGDVVERPPAGEHVRWVTRPQLNVAAARNSGIEQARGVYIAFLDDDDWWYPRKLETVADAIRANPGVGLFYSAFEYVDADGKQLWSPLVPQAGPNVYIDLLFSDFIATSSVVVKRDCLIEAGSFDTALSGCEDWDLWIRLSRRHTVYRVPGVLAAYEYLGEGSLTRDYSKVLKAQQEVLDKAFALDPSLKSNYSRIRAGLAYVRGRVYLSVREDRQASKEFLQAFLLRPSHWQAFVYFTLTATLTAAPFFRRLLPAALRRKLRIPDGLRTGYAGSLR